MHQGRPPPTLLGGGTMTPLSVMVDADALRRAVLAAQIVAQRFPSPETDDLLKPIRELAVTLMIAAS